ncbi:hypothetical protein ACS0TY_026060 [Phlomoides rotata]
MVHIEKPEMFSGDASGFKRWLQRNVVLSHGAASSTVSLGGSTVGARRLPVPKRCPLRTGRLVVERAPRSSNCQRVMELFRVETKSGIEFWEI